MQGLIFFILIKNTKNKFHMLNESNDLSSLNESLIFYITRDVYATIEQDYFSIETLQ